jgi:hypothetical protein
MLLDPKRPVLRLATLGTREAWNGEVIPCGCGSFHLDEEAWRPLVEPASVQTWKCPESGNLQTILEAMAQARREVARDPLGRPRVLLERPFGEVMSAPAAPSDPALSFDDPTVVVQVTREVLAVVGARRVLLAEKGDDPDRTKPGSFGHFRADFFNGSKGTWRNYLSPGMGSISLSWDDFLKEAADLRAKAGEQGAEAQVARAELEKERDRLKDATSRLKSRRENLDQQRRKVREQLAENAMDLERASGLTDALEGFEYLAALPAPLRFSNLRVGDWVVDSNLVEPVGKDRQGAVTRIYYGSMREPLKVWVLLSGDDGDLWLAKLPSDTKDPSEVKERLSNVQPPVVSWCFSDGLTYSSGSPRE